MFENTNLKNLTLTQRLYYLYNLLNIDTDICLWQYDSDLKLTNSTSSRIVLNTIFDHVGCLKYMADHFRASDKPIVLSSLMGLMWAAVKNHNDDLDADYYYVIGPAFSINTPVSSIRIAAKRYAVDPTWQEGFVNLLSELPVISTPFFFQYALMLHYCVNGEKIDKSELTFQQSDIQQTGGKTMTQTDKNTAGNDRTTTYYIEQKLMKNVREGNLNYARDLSNAQYLSTGVRVTTRDPINQGIISTSLFTSLCVRAAIEGGVSPDKAYTIGDRYIQALTGCSTVTDLRTLAHKMYDEFIHIVHDTKEHQEYSRQIQSCIDYIENHVYDPLTLHDLADRVGYTDYYLSGKFKKETGVSISSYINDAKLNAAKELLKSSTDTVAEIAEKLNFCSPSYFSSLFRKKEKILPQEYREQNQKL